LKLRKPSEIGLINIILLSQPMFFYYYAFIKHLPSRFF